MAGILLALLPAWAGQERYDYDPLGRLVRHVDAAGQATDYQYDPAGNLLSVRRDGDAAQAPLLESVTPALVRRGEARTLTLAGQRLRIGTLRASDPGLDLSQVRQGATQVQAELSVAPSVPTGTQTLSFSNAQGTASIGLLVGPALPVLSVEPSPLALPPDNQPHAITVRLSGADVLAHEVSLASSDASRFTVSPSTVVIAPGQVSATVQLLPRAGGFANLTLASALLKPVVVPVFVTTDFRGVNTSRAQPVGVTVGAAQPPQAPPSGPGTFIAPRVGVALGPVLTGVAPQAMPVGAAQALVVTGRGIPADARVSVQPPDGVTVSADPAQATRLGVTLSVAAAAAPGVRRLVVTDGGGRVLPFADPQQSQLRLTSGQPAIASIDPLFGTPGSIVALEVRGRHLQGGQLRLLPDTDLRVDSQPQVDADGTRLVARVQLAPLAATGPRTVQVVTPSGDTGTEPASANQFTVVTQARGAVTPIAAALVGVRVGEQGPGSGGVPVPASFTAPPVGVVVGPVAKRIAPPAGVIGTSLTLEVEGAGLQAVTGVRLLPGDGLAVGAPTVAPGGERLSVPVTIDAAAPRTLRRVELVTGGGRLAFSQPAGDQFLVAAPAPRLVAVAPQVVVAGQDVTMAVRGVNLSGVTGVSFDPPIGVALAGSVVPAADGLGLGFALRIAADAPAGPRTLVVHTAGGSSPAEPEPANTFQVARQAGPTYSGIAAPLVGVRLGAAPAAERSATLGVQAPLVGVSFTASPGEAPESRAIGAPSVGVVVGGAITGLQGGAPDGVARGATRTLIVTGRGLGQVRAVSVVGPGGVSAGAPVVNAEGTQLRVPVTAAAEAASATFGLRLMAGEGASAVRLSAASTGADPLFNVGGATERVDSVSPIVLEQGKAYTFTVRGAGLRDVYEVRVEPADGLRFGQAGSRPQWGTDVLGERLSVELSVEPAAPLGPRVIRLRTPGGETDAQPVPANTVTVIPSQ